MDLAELTDSYGAKQLYKQTFIRWSVALIFRGVGRKIKTIQLINMIFYDSRSLNISTCPSCRSITIVRRVNATLMDHSLLFGFDMFMFNNNIILFYLAGSGPFIEGAIDENDLPLRQQSLHLQSI